MAWALALGGLLSVAAVAQPAEPNQPPVAEPDSYTTPIDTTLAVAAPGLLANDSDPDDDPLVALMVKGTSNGSLTLIPDGSFIYSPAPGFEGSDSFIYHASDGVLKSNVVVVSITVTPAPPTTVPTTTTTTVPTTTVPTTTAPTTTTTTVPTTTTTTVPTTTAPTVATTTTTTTVPTTTTAPTTTTVPTTTTTTTPNTKPGTTTTTSLPDGDIPLSGEDIYRRECSACHQSTGAGTHFGPDIRGEDFSDVMEVLIEGDGEMPAFVGTLNHTELLAVARYTADLGEGEEYDPGYPNGGKDWYDRKDRYDREDWYERRYRPD